MLLEITRDAGDGAAGANPGNHHIHLAVCVLPDFRTGGFFVNRRVGRIFELLQHDALARCRCQQLLCLLNSATHTFGTFCQDQVCAQCLHHFAALYAHGFWHGERNLVATRCCHKSQRDTGITAGGLNDFHARLELTVLFCLPNHIGTDTTFHRVGRVAVFQFREYSWVLCQFADTHQWGVADGLADVLVNLHKFLSTLSQMSSRLKVCHP